MIAKPCLGYPSRTAAVLALRAQGQTNSQIAAAIGIPAKNVSALARDNAKPARQRLTPDQIDMICMLREEGQSSGQIVIKLRETGINISTGAVDWYCLLHGADLPQERQQPPKLYATPRVVSRLGHQVRNFTPAEDDQIRALEAAGHNYAQIGRALGRSRNSILARLATLARHDARAEAAA